MYYRYGAVFLAAYFLGSFPNGLIIGRLLRNKDLRDYGSQNIGATNAYRVLGLGPGLLVLLLDMLKGFLAVHIAALVIGLPLGMLVAGIIAVAGHNWSVFLRFNGGRGIATSVGALLHLMPQVVVILFCVWLFIVLTTRYVSLGSITGAVLLPVMAFLFGQPREYLIFSLLIAVFAIYRHIPNIRRLLKGEENKLKRIDDSR